MTSPHLSGCEPQFLSNHGRPYGPLCFDSHGFNKLRDRKEVFHQFCSGATIARKTGISPRKVKSIYYSEPYRLWAEESETIHEAISGHHSEAVRLLNHQGELSNEINAELKRLFFDFLEAYRRENSQ